MCPGWGGDPPHDATDLVLDHDVGVLCRSHNSRKGATVDKERRTEENTEQRGPTRGEEGYFA